MWMTCSTEGASTPIPRAEVANNTLIRESVFLISVIMAFFIQVVCGAWNSANSLPTGSHFSNKLPISQDSFKQIVCIATVFQFQIYYCHGVLFTLNSQIMSNGKENLIITCKSMMNAHSYLLIQIDVHLVWVCIDNFTVSLFNRCGGAVAVRAMTGTLGKNALTADKSLNSLLDSSPLTK